MGYNSFGQLGLDVDQTNLPTQLPLNGVVAVSGGDEHSLFLESDGSLWAVGLNDFGQLGDGQTDYATNVPEEVVPGGVTAISAGYDHSLFIKTDGSLWGMGYNAQGQLGDGTFDSTNQPVEIVSNGVVAIVAAQYHSLFLKSDGSLWAMGTNNLGQLGDGTLNETNRPEEIISGGVVAIAAGWDQSFFLKSDGTLWGMGSQYYGELGDGFTYGFITNYSTLPELIFPIPQPVLTRASILSKTNLQVVATCGLGGNYIVLSGTNVLQSWDTWKTVRTNSVIARTANNFTTTLTNAVKPSVHQQFYILRSQ
jgi:alpha-tubulin suppressor-like RCC1 family protein